MEIELEKPCRGQIHVKSGCNSFQVGMHIGLISFLIELCLAVHRIGTGHPADIAAVRLLYTGIAVIGQHRIKNVLQARFQSRIRDRGSNLHTS